MKPIKKNYVRHFVEYNTCYITKKSVVISQYFCIFAICFMTFMAIYVDINDRYRERGFKPDNVGGIRTHIFLIAIALIYSLSVLILPALYKRYSHVSEQEELLASIVWCYFYGYVGLIVSSGFGFIYTTQGLIPTLLTIFMFTILNICWFNIRKKQIKQLIAEDGFNEKKNNSKFKRFDCFNRWLWETPIVGFFIWGIGIFLKDSVIGLTLCGFIIQSVTLVSADLLICCILQIQYAREYDMQEYLPMKSRKELKKEEKEKLKAELEKQQNKKR